MLIILPPSEKTNGPTTGRVLDLDRLALADRWPARLDPPGPGKTWTIHLRPAD